MKVRFQESPWDLYVCLIYASVVAVVTLPAGQGSYLGLGLVLVLPGYVVMAALFPREGEIDWIERIALSFGLSIIIVPSLSFGLSLSSYRLSFTPLVLVIVLFTLLVGGLGWWRRIRVPPTERLSLAVNISMPAWKGYRPLDKALTLALTAGVLALAGTLLYVATAPRGLEPATGFFIVAPGGMNASYPVTLNASQPGIVAVTITNREGSSAAYALQINLLGIKVVQNSTSGRNETLEVNRTTLSWFNITLANGQNWTESYTFSISYIGLWKVHFLLFKSGDLSAPYRELHLYVRVS